MHLSQRRGQVNANCWSSPVTRSHQVLHSFFQAERSYTPEHRPDLAHTLASLSWLLFSWEREVLVGWGQGGCERGGKRQLMTWACWFPAGRNSCPPFSHWTSRMHPKFHWLLHRSPLKLLPLSPVFLIKWWLDPETWLSSGFLFKVKTPYRWCCGFLPQPTVVVWWEAHCLLSF